MEDDHIIALDHEFGFIAAEMAKAQVNVGGRRELYYFRDEQGLEVDSLCLDAPVRWRWWNARPGAR